ncbi:hypothetical protein J43TS9_39430 [Paenibacillus cineris]|nr:hypothetical protein J43TS9_39430 [Paenibacillus cineris]
METELKKVTPPRKAILKQARKGEEIPGIAPRRRNTAGWFRCWTPRRAAVKFWS